MANFIPPANGVSQGNYFQAKIPKMAVFAAKTGQKKLQRHPNMQTFFEIVLIFLFMRDEAKKFRKTGSAAVHVKRIMSCFLKSMLVVNFWIQWYSYFLNLFNIFMMLNKSVVWCSFVGITTSSLLCNVTESALLASL